MGLFSNIIRLNSNSFKLSKIILKVTQKNDSFKYLINDEKIKVLQYIQNYNLDIKVFYRKGFDFLKQKFFAIEYLLENQDLATSKVWFDNFSAFYEYVKHEIYGEDSCFYGYVFTSNEISKYKIQKEKINYTSFISYTINDCKIDNEFLDKIKTVKNTDKENKKLKESLDLALSKPTKTKFAMIFGDFNSLNYPEDVCLSMISRNKDIKSKESFYALTTYKCNYYSKYFVYIWFHYGDDDAIQYIDKLDQLGIPQKALNSYKKVLRDLFRNLNDTKNNCKFLFTYDETLALYLLKISFYYFDYLIETIDEYFFSVDEMLNFYNTILPKCNIGNAPKKITDVPLKLKKGTIFPTTCIKSKIIRKYCINDIFYVDIALYDMENREILKRTYDFEYIFDFIYFLNNDLSNCDLSNCIRSENLSKISQLNLENALLNEKEYQEISLINSLNNTSCEPIYIQDIEKNEIEVSNKNTDILYIEPNTDFAIAYISDIHLTHRLSCENIKSNEDIIKYVSKLSKKFKQDYIEAISYYKMLFINKFLFIGGDITDKPSLYKTFISQLNSDFKGDSSRVNTVKIFVTLGNHELWNFPEQSIESITNLYKKYLDSNNMYLVQNNLFYLNSRGIHEINSEDLININDEDLINQTRSAYLIIFGGIGFAGNNSTYNANLGLYRNTINREQEIEETNKFYSLYQKVKRCLTGQNVVVLTHMPIEDWAQPNENLADFIYINGHTHKNTFDNDKKIYSNNQIGYKNKKISLKYVSFPKTYSWFHNYNDGIFEINRLDYILFNQGLNINIEFNYDFDKLYMIKRNNYYIFFLEKNNKLNVLEGGKKIKIKEQNLSYYYERIFEYGNIINSSLREFNALLKLISNEVKKIGGDGTIHGTIVNIDFYNHIYINPKDMTFTFYYATDTINKYVYSNYISLLKNKAPELYNNYLKLIGQKSCDTSLILYNSLELSNKRVYVPETDMYTYSRYIKNLQYLTSCNVIRGWNDTILMKSQKNKEKIISQNISDNLITLKDS